jgi:chitin-binding protein
MMLAAVGGTLAGLAGVEGGTVLAEATAVPAAPAPNPVAPTPRGETAVLRWAPVPAVNGIAGRGRAFEQIEDHPNPPPHDPEEDVLHIFADRDKYRWIMRAAQRDTLAAGGKADRQRNEVAGMLDPQGHPVQMLLGQTWRITYSMFIPSTLQPTSGFTHVMQMKQPNTATAPLVTTSLSQGRSGARIELRAFNAGVVVGTAALPPLQDHWIHSSIEMLIGTRGRLRWVLTDPSRPAASQTVVDAQQANVNIWLPNSPRLWPKFGIYRSTQDPSHLRDTELWIKELKVYQIV